MILHVARFDCNSVFQNPKVVNSRKNNLLNFNDLFFFFLKMDCVYEGTSHNDDFFFPPLLLLQLTSCLPLMSVPLTLQIPCCLSRTIIHPPSCSHLSFTISASTCQVISLFVLPPPYCYPEMRSTAHCGAG